MAVKKPDSPVFTDLYRSSKSSLFKDNWKRTYIDRERRKNKILMVISYPDMRLKKELESFRKNGYDVSLIIWERGWPFQLKNDIEIKSLKLNAPVGHTKTLFYFPIWWCFLLFWLLRIRWDVVHSVNFDTFFFSIIVAKLKRKTIVYDIFDFYGDMMNRFLRPVISNLDKFLMKFADLIIIADDSRISQINKNLENEIITVNNAPNESLFKTKNKISKDVNEFKIFLGGKIVEERGTDQVISAIKDIKNVQLIIKGFCSEKRYKNKLLAMTNDMKNVCIDLNGVPYDEIVQNMTNADLTIALYDPTIPNNRYASPNKLFEAMASGIPIIVNNNTSMADVVLKEKCGMVVPFKDYDALKWAICHIKDDLALRQMLGNNGRKAYVNKYSWNIMEKRLITSYNQFRELKT